MALTSCHSVYSYTVYELYSIEAQYHRGTSHAKHGVHHGAWKGRNRSEPHPHTAPKESHCCSLSAAVAPTVIVHLSPPCAVAVPRDGRAAAPLST